MRTWMVMAAMAMVACTSGDSGLNTGGSSNDPDVWGDDTAPSGDDPGDDGDAPTIRELVVFFDNYPNIGDVLEIQAVFEDAQDDVDGGTLDFTIVPASTGEGVDQQAEINGSDARVEDGAVMVTLQDIEVNDSYEVRAVLTDASGNRSDEAVGSTD